MHAQKEAYKKLKQEWKDAKKDGSFSKEEIAKLKMAWKACQYAKKRRVQKIWINVACACVYLPAAIVTSIQAVQKMKDK